MNMADSHEDIEKLIRNNQMVLVYFGGGGCGVCSSIKPRVEEMLKKYPNIESIQIDVEKSVKAAAAYNIFTIPAILVFIEGKEIIREARYINIEGADNKIKRYYGMLFE
jgi:thiol-disulfide isomerase/thioredoxin